MKIGFYDSGLGGAKLLKDIIDLGLNEEVFLLSDIKNNPYGTKSTTFIKELAIKNVKHLIDLGCEIVVVACNTATSVAIKDLRSIYKNVSIIGIEPAIKVASDDIKHKKIMLLGTTITTKGKKLKTLIERLNIKEDVQLLPLDKLVTLIESINFSNNYKKVYKYLKEELYKYDLKEFSHIVLGCTHFPIVKDVIEDITQEYGIKVIDGSLGIAKNLFKKIKKQSNKRLIHVIVTKKSNAYEKRLKEILINEEYDLKIKA